MPGFQLRNRNSHYSSFAILSADSQRDIGLGSSHCDVHYKLGKCFNACEIAFLNSHYKLSSLDLVLEQGRALEYFGDSQHATVYVIKSDINAEFSIDDG